MVRNGLLLVFIGFVVFAKAQVSNGDCWNAIRLNEVTEYCSDKEEFALEPDSDPFYQGPGCFTDSRNDVWFSFVATATNVSIIVNGASGNEAGGSLAEPQVALYSNLCGQSDIDILGCRADDGNNNIIELTRSGLMLGRTYFIQVDAAGMGTGTFQLCVRNFLPPVEPGQDCFSASILCDTTPFVVQAVTGAGVDPDEARNSCLGIIDFINSEDQSTWFKWEAANDGILEFVLTPLKADDDIDFVLYELPGGLDDCENKIVLRCMATACLGPTGLSANSNEIEEDANCDPGEDGFVSALLQDSGKAYALLINNFTSSGIGFAFEFGGTAEFAGPQVDFDVIPNDASCLDTLIFTNNSFYDNGSIVNYSWSFGEDASVETSSDFGPHEIVYNSFGEKYVLLQVESDKGCISYEIKTIEIDTCCSALDGSLDIEIVEAQDLTCFGIPDGLIEVQGTSSYPSRYQFDFNGMGEFTPISRFDDLDIGIYSIGVIDNFGCENSTEISLTQPEQILVDAGEDFSSELGENVEISATYTPPGLSVNGIWISSNGDSIICLDPLCLNVEVLPPGPTDYIVTVVDEDGCIGRDTVRAIVDIVRNISYPNVFSPNNDGINDYFNLFGGISAIQTYTLRIFDRWGGLLYENQVPLNNQQTGWDGTYNGELLNPGVYAFQAIIEFVDREVVPYTGTITLVR